ncbi:MAG: hypothetical protein JW808_07660 [Victivallales bacterium]|nr:hypothetical protein [Victivallales bacterium]
MTAAIILVPILAGIATFFVKDGRCRNMVLVATAAVHFLLSLLSLFSGASPILGGILHLDETGHLFLCTMSLLFLVSSVYAAAYMSEEHEAHKESVGDGVYIADSHGRLFSASLLIFCGTMSLVCAAGHLGVLWVGIEATTFASAPLVYYYRTRRSLEATWKYVMICSVGIGFSLIGNLLVMVSFSGAADGSLFISDLKGAAGAADSQMLMVAFVFFLVGYGTKTGLAPMHTWLPAAHGESPAFVSSLLSGALLNCAFLGIFRIHGICWDAGIGSFSGGLMIFIGLLSVGAAAFFMVAQKDYKRMLAYSSVEHMGIAMLGAGLGGVAVIAAMLHVINHSLTKGMLFLTSGNILSAFGTRRAGEVSGLSRVAPETGLLWFCGLLAICGTPPSGLFISEFLIMKEMFSGGRFLSASLLLVFLFLIFGVMARAGIEMFFGPSPEGKSSWRESKGRILPSLFLLLLTVLLGLYLPEGLLDFLRKISGGFQP